MKAGRKKIKDKKKLVALYLRKSYVKKVGEPVVKDICYKSLPKEATQ